MRIVITLGKTGGHIFPAIALAQKLLKEPENEIFFIGTKGNLEKKIITGYKVFYLNIDTFFGKNFYKKIICILKLINSFWKSGIILKTINPDIIIGTGSAYSFPVIIMGKILGYKTMILEQNVTLGISNKLLSKVVDLVCLSFENPSVFSKKKQVVGNPVRENFFNINRLNALKELGLENNKKTLLVLGGSQGAKSLNNVFSECLNTFEKNNLQIIHLTGVLNYEQMKNKATKNIIIKPFMINIEFAYKIADLVVARAGATTIAELTAYGLPSILIPYPKASFMHQRYNAYFLQEKGATIVIEEEKLSPEILINTVLTLLNDKNKLQKMEENSKKLGKPDAADKIINLIKELKNVKKN